MWRALLDACADPTVLGPQGKTALDFAQERDRRCGFLDVAREYGYAPTAAAPADGGTPPRTPPMADSSCPTGSWRTHPLGTRGASGAGSPSSTAGRSAPSWTMTTTSPTPRTSRSSPRPPCSRTRRSPGRCSRSSTRPTRHGPRLGLRGGRSHGLLGRGPRPRDDRPRDPRQGVGGPPLAVHRAWMPIACHEACSWVLFGLSSVIPRGVRRRRREGGLPRTKGARRHRIQSGGRIAAGSAVEWGQVRSSRPSSREDLPDGRPGHIEVGELEMGDIIPAAQEERHRAAMQDDPCGALLPAGEPRLVETCGHGACRRPAPDAEPGPRRCMPTRRRRPTWPGPVPGLLFAGGLRLSVRRCTGSAAIDSRAPVDLRSVRSVGFFCGGGCAWRRRDGRGGGVLSSWRRSSWSASSSPPCSSPLSSARRITAGSARG